MPASHSEMPDEQARLRAIREYDVAAAFDEPVFQHLTNLAAYIFHMPVAFLSLVHQSEVDFPHTLGVPGLHTLSRNAALCSIPVQQKLTVVLNGLSTGDDSPQRDTAQAFDMEFYVGTPVYLSGSSAVGALCISDHQTRSFDEDAQRILEQLAAVMSQAIMYRHESLAAAEQQRWQQTHLLASEQVEELEKLVRYLGTGRSPLVSTPASVLQVVSRRLEKLAQLFQ